MGGKRRQSRVCDTRFFAVLEGILNERKQSYGKVSKEPREILNELDIPSDYLGTGCFYLRKKFGVVGIIPALSGIQKMQLRC